MRRRLIVNAADLACADRLLRSSSAGNQLVEKPKASKSGSVYRDSSAGVLERKWRAVWLGIRFCFY